MKWVILSVAILAAFAAASDTIMPLFEARSVAEYNQWLEQHRDEYPNFRPVLTKDDFLTDSVAFPSRNIHRDSSTSPLGEFRLRFGDLPVVPLSELGGLQQGQSCSFVEDGDHCLVYRRNGRAVTSTAYDRYGRKLFETCGHIQHRFNLWFRDTTTKDSLLEPQPWPRRSQAAESTQVIDDKGNVIGVLPRISIQGASSSGDTLIAAGSHDGTAVFDHKARVRWRDSMFGAAPRVAVISPDGRKVAVITRDSVGLHDLLTGRNKTWGVHPGTATRYRTNRVAWSGDGRRFAVYRADWHIPDTALLWTFTSGGKGAARPRRLKANCGDRPFWSGDTVLLIASPYFTDQRWTANKQPPAGPCRVTAVTLRGGVRTWFVKGSFEWDDVWYQQGRSFAYVDRSRGYAAVFEVPIQ
jgi:hypothetical protein